MTLKRWTGEDVGTFGTPMRSECTWADCEARRVFLPCNAEGDANRAHHTGMVHDLSHYRDNEEKLPSGAGALCETHGLRVLANNDTIAGNRKQP